MSTSPSSTPSRSPRGEYDPVFLHSRREAMIIFAVWVAALLWAVPYCYLNGYTTSGGVDAGNLEMVWGIPSWVFWGIGFPWLVADVFTVWFCFWYMKDDDLGETGDELMPEDGGQRGEGLGPGSQREEAY